MKSFTRILFTVAFLGFLGTSCSVFKKKGEGCPSDGRNVGAEKVLSGEASKGKKKSPKFRGPSSYSY